jgi:hypothetical protein
MGQTQSGVISVDQFSDRVMGAAVVLLSSQLDSSLTFKSVGQIQPTDTHVLPLLTDEPDTNPSTEQLVELYSNYYSEDKQELINKYITEHILDSEAHVSEFISLLINGLRKKSVSTPQNYYSKSAKSVGGASASIRTKIEQRELEPIEPVKSQTQAQQVKVQVPSVLSPVKGSNKLQKRMHAIDQAIDAERLVAQSVHSKVQPAESVHSKVQPAESVHSRAQPAESVRSKVQPAESVHSRAPTESVRSKVQTAESVKTTKTAKTSQTHQTATVDEDRLSQIKQNIDASYSEEGLIEAIQTEDDFEHI